MRAPEHVSAQQRYYYCLVGHPAAGASQYEHIIASKAEPCSETKFTREHVNWGVSPSRNPDAGIVGFPPAGFMPFVPEFLAGIMARTSQTR